MSHRAKKDISLKKDSCTSCQLETNNIHFPIVLQPKAPDLSVCTCSDSIEQSESLNKKFEFTVLQTSPVKAPLENPFTMINPSSSCCDDDNGSNEITDKTVLIAQNMKKGQTFIIEGMDCGVCAQTLERYLKTLPKVREVSVNFSTGKMQLVHDMTLEEVIKAVSKSGFKATLVSRAKNTIEAPLPAKKFTISLSTISGILLALGYLSNKMPANPELISILLYGVSIIIGVYKPARSAYYAIKSKSLDMNVLMTTAALGAALIGQWLEAATVVWLFSLGTTLQTKTIDKTRASIRDLMNLAPPEAWLKIGDSLIRTSVDDISVSDTVVIKPGERVPLDGEELPVYTTSVKRKFICMV